jgi:hypothetical protein
MLVRVDAFLGCQVLGALSELPGVSGLGELFVR